MSDRATQPLLSGPYYQALIIRPLAIRPLAIRPLAIRPLAICVQHSRPISSKPTEHVQGDHVIQEVM